MGFPSPAQDFVENRLNPHDMCTTENSRILETSEGYAVIDPVIKLTVGEVLLIQSFTFYRFTITCYQCPALQPGELCIAVAQDQQHFTYS
ncbi:hypothetical protein ACUOA8_36930, partial [Escherichia sp. SS-MK2]